MIFVEPIELWHIDAFLDNPREYDKCRFCDSPGLRDDLINLSRCTMAKTFLTKDAEVVALWFIAQRNNGRTAVVFSCMTALVDKHALDFMKACKMSIEILTDALNLTRIEAFVDKGYLKSQKWLERLGFKNEGSLKDHTFLTAGDIPVPISISDKIGHIVMGRSV